MERASGLSESWKIRLALIEKDFMREINILKIRVENSIEEDDDCEHVEKMMDNIFKLQEYIIEIDEIMKKINRYPLPHDIVQRISEFENEYYEIIMTDEILEELNNELSAEEKLEKAMNDVILGVNRMWDDNKTEEEIKSYMIYELKDFYPRHSESQFTVLINDMYNYLTGMKPVRVSLNDEQIGNLKRETDIVGTCGICLENFESGTEGIVLSCKHVYHSHCIIPWLKLSVRCPTCRHDLRQI